MTDGPQAIGNLAQMPPGSAAFYTVVVMGPSGCGKSTLARALAQALGRPFIEGDEYHPPENIAKMQSGEPLSEKDRLPFLANVGRALMRAAPAVASCSALRRTHRDILRGFVNNIVFVLPLLDEEELARRVQRRTSHFMPASLLQSQISATEPPSAEECFMTCDGAAPTSDQVQAVLQHLSKGRG